MKTLLKLKNVTHHLMAALIFASITQVTPASVKDVFNLNPDGSFRVSRDSKYYPDRSASSDIAVQSRLLKPEDLPEARESQTSTALEKRCSRCDSTYTDYRGGGSGGGGYYRTDSRYQDPRYDSRRYYDDSRYDSYDRYDNYDPYYTDSYYDRDRSRRPSNYGRDDYDRYEPGRDRYNGRDRNYDRNYDRGVGYDNIGYDYRGYERYRPYDETYRGTSGWDTNGRGYYVNRGTPDTTSRYNTYASSWGYGRDDRDRGYRDYGSYRTPAYRPRDSFSYGTSYLYGRPSSSTTTSNPSSSQDSDNSVTDSPNETPSTDSIFFNIMSLPLKIIDKKSV